MPIYKHGQDVYDIPDGEIDGFEAQYPDATVEMYDGEDAYAIPVGYKKDFLAQYPGATYKRQSKTSTPSDEFTVTQEQLDAMPTGDGEEKSDLFRPKDMGTRSMLDMGYKPEDKFATALSKKTQGDMTRRRRQDYEMISGLAKGSNANTPESAARLRATLMEKTGMDPAIEVPGLFKDTHMPLDDDTHYANWLNLSEDEREAWLQKEQIHNLTNPGAETREMLEGIRRRADEGIAMLVENQPRIIQPQGAGTAIGAYYANALPTQTAKALTEAGTIIEAYRNHQNDENFFVGAAKGLKDGMLDIDNWTGVYMAGEMGSLYNIADKMEKGEALTQDEEDFLDAQAYRLAVEASLADDLGWGYKSGNTTGASIPFMLQMLASPVSGSTGAAINKGFAAVGKRALSKFGGTLLKKIVNKAAGTTAGRAVQSGLSRTVGGKALGHLIKRGVQGTANAWTAGTAQTLLFQPDRMAANILDKKIGDRMVAERADAQFNTNLSPTARDGMDWLEAGIKGSAGTISENATEFFGGEFLEPFMKVMGDAVRPGVKAFLDGTQLEKFMKVVGESKAMRAIASMKAFNGPSAKFMKEVTGKAQWNGLFNEYLEEVVNGGVNVLTGDMDAEDWLSVKHNAETLLGLAWTSGAFGVLNAGARTRAFSRAARNVRQIDLAARQYWAENPEQWEQFKASLEDVDSYEELLARQNRLVDELGRTSSDKEMNRQKARTAMQYMQHYAHMMGMNAAEAQDGRSEAQTETETALGEGMMAETPEQQKDIVAELAAAQAQLEAATQGQDADTWLMQFGETPDMQLQGIRESGLDEQTVQDAETYIMSMQRYNGVTAVAEQEIEGKVKAARAEFDANVNADNGRVIQVHTKATKDMEDPVYVIKGNTDGGVITIRRADGSMEQIPASDIVETLQDEDAAPLREAMMSGIEQEAVREVAARMQADHVITGAEMQMQAGQNVIVGGQQAVVTGMTPDGTYTVQTQEGKTMEASPQDVTDAASYNAVQERMQRAAQNVKHSITPQAQQSSVAAEEAPQKTEAEAIAEEFMDESLPLEERMAVLENNKAEAAQALAEAQAEMEAIQAQHPQARDYRSIAELKAAKAQWQQQMSTAQAVVAEAQRQSDMWDGISASVAEQTPSVSAVQTDRKGISENVAEGNVEVAKAEAIGHNAKIDVKEIARQTGYKAKDIRRMIDFANRQGVKLNFANYTRTGGDTGAFTNAQAMAEKREITISKARMAEGLPLEWVMGHEMTHQVKADGNAENWEAYKQSIINAVGEDTFRRKVEETARTYRAAGAYQNMTVAEFNEAMEEEVCADMAGYLFLNPYNINKVMGVPESLASHIWNWMKSVVGKDTPQSVKDAVKAWGELAEGKELTGQTDMTPEERRQTRPGKTEDVAREEQTVLEDESGIPMQESIGRSLTADEAATLITDMKENADIAPELEFSINNWLSEFGKDGLVATPIGKVKMGENQIAKLLNNKRDKREKRFGLIRPTLETPDVIVEKYAPEEGAERDSKYLYIKTFVKPDGSRFIHFESVTVLKDGMDVSISSHEIGDKALRKEMQNGTILHLNSKLSSGSDKYLTKTPTERPDLVPAPDNRFNISPSLGGGVSPISHADDAAPAISLQSRNDDELSADKDTQSVSTVQTDRKEISGKSAESNVEVTNEEIMHSISPIEGYTYSEVIDMVQNDVENILSEEGTDNVEAVEFWAHGSRMRGNAREDSDLDVVMFYKGNEKEDSLFNLINEHELAIDGIKVDVNPIRVSNEQDIARYKEKSARYDQEMRFSLAGLHNISEEKLKKAIKQGGLANPSVAVIDLDTRDHNTYGDITLVLPSYMIDRKQGRNAGTYMGDAWTPTYPRVSMRLDNKGWRKIDEFIASISDDAHMRSNMHYAVEDFMQGGTTPYMQYAFLRTKGIEIPFVYKNNDRYISNEEFKELIGMDALTAFNGSIDAYNKFKELPKEVQDELYIWIINRGDKAKIKALKESIQKDQRYAKLFDYEVPFSKFNMFASDTFRREQDNGKIDYTKTFSEANNYVATNGLGAEYNAWISNLLEEAGAEEYIFAGFTPSGNAKYLPHTLENVSKVMKKAGKSNAYNDTGYGPTRAGIIKALSTLGQIRKNSDTLRTDINTVDETKEELADRLYELTSELADMRKLSDNPFINGDYAERRLQDALSRKNPVRHLNEEYGYNIEEDGDFAKKLESFIDDVRKAPVRYFETKFERPVMLDEFHAAVIPNDTDTEVVKALEKAGLNVETYERGNDAERKEALLRASDEHVRFSLSAEELDAEYMSALEVGDMAKAQQMVDNALADAGYTIRGEHGTTHKFTIFSNINANIENSFGKGFYFTSNREDAEANYASDNGPDLTNRIKLLAERMEFEDGYEDMDYDERIAEARKRLSGGENLIISAALRMENPCVFSYDPEGEYQETIFDVIEDYDEETDEYGEPAGLLVDFVNSLNEVLATGEYWGADMIDANELLSDVDYTADQLKRKVDEMLAEIQDEDGNLASSEIFRAALENMGFDGIIDNAPSLRFRNMGLGRDTKHYIVFSSNQVKQSDAVTYDNEGNVIPLSERANAKNADIRYSMPTDILAANERFNEELDEYIKKGTKANFVFHIGQPLGIMKLFFPELPIVMRPRVINKASNTKHDVDAASLYNLPQYIAEPIFVFQREDGAIGVLTEMMDNNGKNVCVAVELNKKIQDGGTYLDVNDIRSIHGRDVKNIVLPIIHNNTLKYADKKKALDWFSSASSIYQQEITSQELSDATKVVENFQNPPLPEDESSQNDANATSGVQFSLSPITPRGKEESIMDYAQRVAKAMEAQKAMDVVNRTATDIDRQMKESEEYRRILAQKDPQTIEEAASVALAGGKLLWDDHVDGTKVSKGVRSMMGWGEGERRTFFAMFAAKENGGASVEQMGESVMEICSQYNIPVDETDAMAGVNAVLEVLQSAQRPSDITGYIEHNRIEQVQRMVEEEQEMLAGERNKAYMDMYGMTYDDFVEIAGSIDAEDEQERTDDKNVIAWLYGQSQRQQERITNAKAKLKQMKKNGVPKAQYDAAYRTIERLEAKVKQTQEKLDEVTKELRTAKGQATRHRKANMRYKARKGQWKLVYDKLRNAINGKNIRSVDKSTLNDIMRAVGSADLTGIERIFGEAGAIEDIVLGVNMRATQDRIDKLLATKTTALNDKGIATGKSVDASVQAILANVRKTLEGILHHDIENRIHDLRSRNWHIRHNALGDLSQEQQAEVDANNAKIAELKAELDRELATNTANTEQAVNEQKEKLTEQIDKKIRTEEESAELMTTLALKRQMVAIHTSYQDTATVEALLRRKLSEVRTNWVALHDGNIPKDKRAEYRQKRKALQEQIAGLEAQVREGRQATLDAMQSFAESLEETITTGRANLKGKMQEQLQRRKEFVAKAIHDVNASGKQMQSVNEADKQENDKLPWYKRMFSPALRTFDYMLQKVATRTYGKDSWLYRQFMLGENGVMAAHDEYLRGMQTAARTLEDKAKEIFGKSYQDVMADSNRKKDIGIEILRDAEDYEPSYIPLKLTKGQATYIYMLWRMRDGYSKLATQGFTEEIMERIEEYIGDDYIQWADWVQTEYLPMMREKYNSRYREIYDTNMAAIDNYVPIRIHGQAIRKEVDLTDATASLPGMQKKNGALIQRTVNVNPIDISNNVFELIGQHIDEMEEFYAYAPVRRDLQYVLSSPAFRNQLNAQEAGTYQSLLESARIATKTNQQPESAALKAFNDFMNKTQKGLVSANIAYRNMTAIKQVLSAPAFIGYSQNPRYLGILAKNMLGGYLRNLPAAAFPLIPGIGHWAQKTVVEETGKGMPRIDNYLGETFRWCMREFPDFRERVTRGSAGDIRLEEKGFSELLDKYTKLGMSANVFIDAVTVSIGLKSIYDYEMQKAEERIGRMAEQAGFNSPEERAEWMEAEKRKASNLAKIQATLFANQTQQSSNPALLSPMQVSKNFMERSLTLYKNSPLGLMRTGIGGMRDLLRFMKGKKARRRMTEEYTRRFIEEGFSENDAKKMAISYLNSGARKGAFVAVLEGFVMNVIWNLGSRGLLGFMDGGDEPEKERTIGEWVWDVSKFVAKNTVGSAIPFVDDVLEGRLPAIGLTTSEAEKAWKDIARQLEENGISLALALTGMRYAAKFGGVDMQVWANTMDGYYRLVAETGNDDETILALMLILNSPHSNRMAVARDLYKGKSEEEFQKAIELAGRYNQPVWTFGREMTDKMKGDMASWYLYDNATEEEKQRMLYVDEMEERIDNLETIEEAMELYDEVSDTELRKKISDKMDRLAKPMESSLADKVSRKKEDALAEDEPDNSGYAYLKMSGSRDILEDKRLDAEIDALRPVYEGLKEAGDKDEYRSRHREELLRYSTLKRYRSVIGKHKKALGREGITPGEQQEHMDKIRELRKDALSM